MITAEFYQTSEGELQPMLLNSVQKKKKERKVDIVLPNFSYSQYVSNIKTSKRHNNKGNTLSENAFKILSKTFIDLIQAYIQIVVHHNNGFVSENRGCFNIHNSVNVLNNINRHKTQESYGHFNCCQKGL